MCTEFVGTDAQLIRRRTRIENESARRSKLLQVLTSEIDGQPAGRPTCTSAYLGFYAVAAHFNIVSAARCVSMHRFPCTYFSFPKKSSSDRPSTTWISNVRTKEIHRPTDNDNNDDQSQASDVLSCYLEGIVASDPAGNIPNMNYSVRRW